MNPQPLTQREVRTSTLSTLVSVTNGVATSFIAGDTDYFLDIIELTIANASTVAATVALTNDGTTIRTFVAPASTTLCLQFNAPLKQNTKNTPWLVDMEDISGTTLNIGAYLMKTKN